MYRAIMTPGKDNRVVQIPQEYWDQKVEVLVLPFQAMNHVDKRDKTKKHAWHEFVEQTYGSFAEDPLVRPEQGTLEQREALL